MLLIAHCFSFVCLFSNVVRALLLRNVDDDVEMDMKNWFWLVSFISFLSFFLFFFHFKWNAEAPFFGWTHPLLWTAIFIPQLLWFRLDIVLDLKTFCFSSGWEGGRMFLAAESDVYCDMFLIWVPFCLVLPGATWPWKDGRVISRVHLYLSSRLLAVREFSWKKIEGVLFLFDPGKKRWRPVAREAQPEIFDLVLYCAIKFGPAQNEDISRFQMKRSCVGSTTTKARSVMAGRIVAFGNLLWPFRFYS